MKKLVAWNSVLYAILYSVSLLYIGYQYGEASQYPYPRGPEYFIFPAVYLVLLIISIFLSSHYNYEYCTSKSYCAMAFATLGFICIYWGMTLLAHSQGRFQDPSDLNLILYPGVLFVFSVAIAVIYFICAAKVRKRNKEVC